MAIRTFKIACRTVGLLPPVEKTPVGTPIRRCAAMLALLFLPALTGLTAFWAGRLYLPTEKAVPVICCVILGSATSLVSAIIIARQAYKCGWRYTVSFIAISWIATGITIAFLAIAFAGEGRYDLAQPFLEALWDPNEW